LKTSVHISHSPEDTWALARTLAAELPERAVLALHGELGSGKTCFVQGLARALGITQAVTSPTFTLVSEYSGTKKLFHIDLYRLQRPEDVLAIGLDEYVEADGIKAVEWAERAGNLLPPDTIHIAFEVMTQPEQRRIVVKRPEN